VGSGDASDGGRSQSTRYLAIMMEKRRMRRYFRSLLFFFGASGWVCCFCMFAPLYCC